MTSLNIQQATDRTEQVTSNIIDKLYTAALGADTVLLTGNIRSTTAHQRAYDYLNSLPSPSSLYISCDALYVDFEDSNWETTAAILYGDGDGVTVAQMKQAGTPTTTMNASAIENNVDIKDLRWCYFNPNASGNWNTSAVSCCGTKLIVGQARIFVDSTAAPQNINKIVGNTLNIWLLNNRRINTVAARNLIGIYGNQHLYIDKLYVGSTTPPSTTSNYLNDITEIYIPVGCTLAYSAADKWSDHTSGFIEYNFDTDPDGIFTEVDEWWNSDGTRKNT